MERSVGTSAVNAGTAVEVVILSSFSGLNSMRLTFEQLSLVSWVTSCLDAEPWMGSVL